MDLQISSAFSDDADGSAGLVAAIEVSDAFQYASCNKVREEGFVTRVPRPQFLINHHADRFDRSLEVVEVFSIQYGIRTDARNEL